MLCQIDFTSTRELIYSFVCFIIKISGAQIDTFKLEAFKLTMNYDCSLRHPMGSFMKPKEYLNAFHIKVEIFQRSCTPF